MGLMGRTWWNRRFRRLVNTRGEGGVSAGGAV